MATMPSGEERCTGGKNNSRDKKYIPVANSGYKNIFYLEVA
jgi:hypothetical protein